MQFTRCVLFLISTLKGPSWDIHVHADVSGSPQAKRSTVSCWPRSYSHCLLALPPLSEDTGSLICWHADESLTDLDGNWIKSKCQWVALYAMLERCKTCSDKTECGLETKKAHYVSFSPLYSLKDMILHCSQKVCCDHNRCGHSHFLTIKQSQIYLHFIFFNGLNLWVIS